MSKVTQLLENLSALNSAELDEVRALIASDAERLAGEPTTLDTVARLTTAADHADLVAAAGAPGRVARMARAQRPAQRPPEQGQRSAPSRPVLTASAALRNVDPGAPIEDRMVLARAMSETLQGMDRRAKPRGDVLLATARWTYPENRRLTEDPEQNARIVDAVVHPLALVASGGVCAPVNVDYSVGVWAVPDRPLRDGLPAFDASRGGLTFVPPPDLGALAGATGVWTAATDINPLGATKPIISVVCGVPVTTYVDAVPTRLQFGNMQLRFSPEQVAANTDLAMAAAARVAEVNLLNKIAAFSTQNIQNVQTLGATRDLLTVLEQARAGYVDLHRLGDEQVVTVVLPRWVRAMIKTDLLRELAHDNAGEFNVLGVTNEQVNMLLRAHGVNPIWTYDGQPVNGAVYPAQSFPVQAAGGQINKFPGKVVWYMFAEGFVQFLDGGRLDLGVVRDSTLDATNDMELFVETFEAVAYRGVPGGSLQLVTTLCANGQTSSTSVVATCA